MANDLNRVLLIGRLTRDPELKSIGSGTVLCKFSLASNRSYYKNEGDLKEEVSFFNCVAWGKLAETISKYVTKGQRLGIDGSLRWSQWENTEGKKQSKVEIKVENFQFLDSKGSAFVEEGNQGRQSTMNSEQETEAKDAGPNIIDEDDIPF